jgi:hypothetical protein
LGGAVLRNYTGLGWNLALLETPLDAAFAGKTNMRTDFLWSLRRTPQSRTPQQNATSDP